MSQRQKGGARDWRKPFSTSNKSKDTAKITETGTRELLTCAMVLLRREESDARPLADRKLFRRFGLVD